MTTTIPDISNLTAEQKLVMLRTLLSEFATVDRKISKLDIGKSTLQLLSDVERRKISEDDYHAATPEYLAELTRRAQTPANSFTFEEFLKSKRS